MRVGQSLLCLSLFPGTQALARDLSVPAAYPTIAAAVEAASAGDVVRIAPGTYTESIVVTTELAIEADPSATWQAPAGTVALTASGGVNLAVRNITLEGSGSDRLIELHDSVLTLERSSLRRGSSAGDGGSLLADGRGSVTVRDCAFEGASAQRGGHIAVRDDVVLTIERSTFSSGQATQEGGAISVDSSGAFTIVGATFEQNASDRGGAINARSTDATIQQSLFCANRGEHGGGLYVEDSTVAVSGTAFVGNSADFGGGLFVEGGSASLSQTNVHYVGNSTTGGEGMAVFDDRSSTHTNVLLVDHHGYSIHALWDGMFSADIRYPLFWDNSPWGTNSSTTEPVFADPLLNGWPSTRCDPEDLRLLPGSPAIDAGSPAITDPDGTRSDIGAFGGPTPLAHDADADGTSVQLDCDDGDDTIFPGAGEITADGIDQDCDGGDLCWEDTDGDAIGEEALIWSVDLDCDDPGEASEPGDLCLGHDDRDDPDADGVPTGCDPCPLDPLDDSDGDGVCDSDDLCPGQDDQVDCDPEDTSLDADMDGVVDSRDPAPDDDGSDGIPSPPSPPGCGHTPAVPGLWVGLLLLRLRRRHA